MTINNTEIEISKFFDIVTTSNISNKIVEFYQQTQTTSLITPYNQFQNIFQLILLKVNVKSNYILYLFRILY